MVDHRVHGLHVDAVASIAQIHDEHAQALGPLFHVRPRRRPRKQDHQVRVLHPRNEDLLSVHDVAIALPLSEGRDAGRIRSGVRLGDRKRLQPECAGGDAGQPTLLLLRGAVSEQGAHGVHLRVAGRCVSSRAVDLFQDHCRLPYAQAGSPVLLRNQASQVARVCQLLNELLWIDACAVAFLPVLGGIPSTELADLLPQLDVHLSVHARRPMLRFVPQPRSLGGPPSHRRA